MFHTCESSNAGFGSDHSMAANSSAELHRNADGQPTDRNVVIGVCRLLAAMLENETLENSEVSS